jgi:hypothetical protein
VIGWNGRHTAVTLPDGTPVSSGEGGGVRVGGGGAYQQQFNKHMYLPVQIEQINDPAAAPVDPMAAPAPEPAALPDPAVVPADAMLPPPLPPLPGPVDAPAIVPVGAELPPPPAPEMVPADAIVPQPDLAPMGV